MFLVRHITTSRCPPFKLLQTNYHSLAYNHLLNSCSSLKNLQRLHAVILTQGLSSQLALLTKFIALASTLSPTMEYARNLFDALPHQDSFAWNTLIRGYADLGPCEEVMILYKDMRRASLSPDHFTFPFVVRACAVLLALREGTEVHCNVIKNGFGANVFVQSSLVTMYANSGEMSDSKLVFDEMGLKNVVSWTAMIAGYVQNGFSMRALGVFQKMVTSGTQPNEITLVSVLPACKGLEYLNAGRSVHGFVIKSGMESFTSLVNALIAMYGKCGGIVIARLLFDSMDLQSLASWNTMIAVYEQNCVGGKAIKLFRQMLTEKVKFDSVTLVSVISACASLGALGTGKWVQNLARSSGLETDVRVGNALLDMYAKCGCLDSARDIFEKLQWRGVVSWSALIGAYAAHGHAEEALNLFSRMKLEGIRPNSFTFTSVLAACSHSGLIEEGMEHFNSMRRDYTISPTIEHCACMVDILGRAGRLTDAYEFIRKMPVEPDTGVWGALLGACRIHGNLDLAELVAEELSQSDPHNVTFYVLMSNIYADAARWEDAARWRKMMKKQELKKTPGHSLVHIYGRFYNPPSE